MAAKFTSKKSIQGNARQSDRAEKKKKKINEKTQRGLNRENPRYGEFEEIDAKGRRTVKARIRTCREFGKRSDAHALLDEVSLESTTEYGYGHPEVGGK